MALELQEGAARWIIRPVERVKNGIDIHQLNSVIPFPNYGEIPPPAVILSSLSHNARSFSPGPPSSWKSWLNFS